MNTNLADAMSALVCKKYTKANFVISTGTNLESMRFRSKLARIFGVPVSEVKVRLEENMEMQQFHDGPRRKPSVYR